MQKLIKDQLHNNRKKRKRYLQVRRQYKKDYENSAQKQREESRGSHKHCSDKEQQLGENERETHNKAPRVRRATTSNAQTNTKRSIESNKIQQQKWQLNA